MGKAVTNKNKKQIVLSIVSNRELPQVEKIDQTD